jgi:hypothetical protein
MKIHLMGHASLFVETQDCRILMDPLLWDPHQEGLFDICPKREAILEKIPEFDVLIISHRHLDHFDIRSLASLPKNVDVLIPQDKLIEGCLRQLGYEQIYILKDFNEVKLGATRLLATRSENRVPEYGIIFADESGVCWNQVDTIVHLNTIRFVKHRFEKIDLLLAVWQPMLEVNYQTNQSLSFPYFVYSKMLENLNLIDPKAIAPGSNGFRCIDGSSWLNQIVFPVTIERFCHDVKKVCPNIGDNVFALDPGDIVRLDNGQVSQLKGQCEFIEKLADNRDSLDFSPVQAGNALVDRNPDNYDLDEMKEAITEEISTNLPDFINKHKDLLFIEHCRWQVIYQLEIVFPNFRSQWSFDFSEERIQAKAGRNPLANVFTSLTASNFYGILKRIKGWDYATLGGYYRHFQKVYIPTPHGIIKPDGEQIPDPLNLRFPYPKILESILQQELEKWKKPPESEAKPSKRKSVMMRIGNTLIRLVN